MRGVEWVIEWVWCAGGFTVVGLIARDGWNVYLMFILLFFCIVFRLLCFDFPKNIFVNKNTHFPQKR